MQPLFNDFNECNDESNTRVSTTNLSATFPPPFLPIIPSTSSSFYISIINKSTINTSRSSTKETSLHLFILSKRIYLSF